MKRFLLPAVAAAAVLTLGGCTKTETVNVSDANYIGFDNAFVGNPTKAITEVKTNNIDHFIVYGGYDGVVDLFDKVRVSMNSNGEWTYSPLQQWEDNQTYKFAAYYPEALTVTPAFDYVTGSLTFTDVVVNNTENQVDFIYNKSGDISSGTNSPRTKVPFTFEHMFSMVQFTIKSGFAEDVVVGISDFKFYGMNSQNTLQNGQWAATTQTQILEGDAIELGDGNAQAVAEAPVNYVDNCVVMPQAFESGVVFAKFTVTLTSTGTSLDDIPVGERTAVITAAIPKDTWERGYRYNYIVTIDGQNLDYITFNEPEVSTWKDYENIDLGNTEV